MSSSLTQEQKNDIRKNLPLKILERREDAAKIEANIRYNKDLLSNLMQIEIRPGHGQHIEFSGSNFWDKKVTAYANVSHKYFRLLRDDFANFIRDYIRQKEDELAAIPNAKIIPFDFRKKEVEPDRQLHPNPPPPKEEPQTILKGAGEIAKAAGIHCSEVRPFIRRKALPAFKIPGRKFWYAFPEEIEKWKENQEVKGGSHDSTN